MNRSSTSNSKTLNSFPLPTRSFCGALVILIIVRVILLFNPDPLYPLAATAHERYSTTWEQLYRKSTKEPKVLITGSSRLRLMPIPQFRGNLNLESEDVLNLSRPRNSFVGIHTFIKRNPDILNRCDLIIIDLLPVQLYNKKFFTQEGAAFFRYATLDQKFAINNTSIRSLALADAVFPFHSLRFTIDQWRIGLFHTHEQKLSYNREVLTRAVTKLANGLANLTELELKYLTLKIQFPQPHFLSVQANALYKIFNAVSDDAKVLLLRPPYRADIEHLIQTDPQLRESNELLESFIKSINHENAQIFWMDSPQQYGLTDEDYNNDGAHLSKTGLKKLTSILSAFIKENELL